MCSSLQQKISSVLRTGTRPEWEVHFVEVALVGNKYASTLHNNLDIVAPSSCCFSCWFGEVSYCPMWRRTLANPNFDRYAVRTRQEDLWHSDVRVFLDDGDVWSFPGIFCSRQTFHENHVLLSMNGFERRWISCCIARRSSSDSSFRKETSAMLQDWSWWSCSPSSPLILSMFLQKPGHQRKNLGCSWRRGLEVFGESRVGMLGDVWSGKRHRYS